MRAEHGGLQFKRASGKRATYTVRHVGWLLFPGQNNLAGCWAEKRGNRWDIVDCGDVVWRDEVCTGKAVWIYVVSALKFAGPASVCESITIMPACLSHTLLPFVNH